MGQETHTQTNRVRRHGQEVNLTNENNKCQPRAPSRKLKYQFYVFVKVTFLSFFKRVNKGKYRKNYYNKEVYIYITTK